MALITYKGISQNSSIERKLTDEEFNQIAIDYYTKPDIGEVRKQLKKIHNGGTIMNKVYDYFLKEVASKAIGPRASWSIWDGIHYKPIMEYFAGKTDVNKNIFPDTASLAQNIETAFRLCGIRYCVKLPNFPIKTVDYIINKYCPKHGNYYDFSCGWGARMIGALHNEVNYYGTDPNYELVDALHEIENAYHRVNQNLNYTCIKCQGSEKKIIDWENQMDLAFSSPPYYNLEDYVIGEQSYKPGVTYNDWLNNYMVPTIKNVHYYLKSNGIFAINVKNFDLYKIESDVNRIALENGFELIEIETLKNTKRCHGDVKSARGEKEVTLNDNDEKIYVFKKSIKL